jgi:salicylate hydroxylase
MRGLQSAGVAVVGAGVAGLAFALAAARRGAEVQVLEQAPALETGAGAGIQISPNGAVVLRALGLGAALEAAGMRAAGIALFDGIKGRRLLRLDLAKFREGAGYFFLHRADLIAILADAAVSAGVRIRMGVCVAEVDLSGKRPVARLIGGESVAADLVIGADGVKSGVRRALNGVTAPWFTGQAAWRAMIPDTGGTDAVAEVHMGPGRHLVSYPVRDGTLRNIVAVERRRSWLAEGWSHADDPAHLRAAFAEFSPKVQGWLSRVDEVGIWGLYRHPVARHWYRALPAGGVALIGDAVHPTLPFLAQGANMALEDAWVLAAALDRDGITEAALAAFHVARDARVRRIVAGADGNARLYHLGAPWRQGAHLALLLAGKVAPGRMLSRYDWLWGHDATGADQASSVTVTGT